VDEEFFCEKFFIGSMQIDVKSLSTKLGKDYLERYDYHGEMRKVEPTVIYHGEMRKFNTYIEVSRAHRGKDSIGD